MGVKRIGRGLPDTTLENYLERLRITSKHLYTANLHYLEHIGVDERLQL
jgi:hypothetical protein